MYFSANGYQSLPFVRFFYIPLQLDLVNSNISTAKSPLDSGSSMFCIQSWNFADCDKDMSWNFLRVLWFMTCEFMICEVSEKNIFSLRWLAWRCGKLRSKHIFHSYFKLRDFMRNGNFIFPENVLWCIYILGWRKVENFCTLVNFALNTVVIVFLSQLKCAYVKLTWT